ncbi:MAG: ABC transporter permease [Lachnospiraceae bacterium]|nr:ABC transporter permease [Lachnospiraceae bacterium]
MKKIRGLILHNLIKDKGQYASFGIILLITAFILNLALVLTFQVDKAYDKKLNDLDTANINFCIPQMQDKDVLSEECLKLTGVKDVERREGIFVSAVMKEFRGVDFTMNTVFYNLDEARRLNQFKLLKESGKEFDAPVYVPLFVAEFGEFQLGDDIIYEIDGEEYLFQIAGILEEMQYGNAGSGLLLAYLPEETYRELEKEREVNRIAEYSLMTDGNVQDIKNEISTMLSEENIHLLSILDRDSAKQVRTMVCNLTILILVVFSFIILLVSMFLCKFRIQNGIEEEITNMGVLKALGYTGSMIIFATILPYMLVGVLTAFAGACLSYLLLPVLSESLAMQSGFSFALHFDAAALFLTVLLLGGITLFFTYFAAKRIKKLVPIDAIRGNSPDKGSKRNYFPLDKTAGSLQINLILKQTAASAKQNVLLFIVSFLMMMLVAFAGTLFYNVVICPENFSSTLSEEMPGIILTTKPETLEYVKNELKDKTQIEKVLEYTAGNVKTKAGSATAFLSEDFSLVSNDLCYEGRNPEKDNEIAVGSAYAEDYSIGDKIEIQCGDNTYTYDIVGYVQSVNYQGEVIELTKEGYLHLDSNFNSQSLYLYLADGVDAEAFLREIEEEYDTDIIASVNYDKMMESSQGMYQGIVKGIIAAIFLVTVLIVFLILSIIIKSLIVRRKQEFGIYKAMGYSNIQLIIQIAGSFLPVSIAAVLTSAILGIWYMPVVNKVLFQMIGAMKNNLQVSLTVLLLFAAAQIAADFIISVCLALPIKKISAYSLIKE